ncbi:MAG: OmpA family protein [Nitrospirota bacterium]
MKKRRPPEQDNIDRWMVSYADFITLLFALFTTLYAISQVDVNKLERFSTSMKSAFKSSPEQTAHTPPVIEGIIPVPNTTNALEKEIRSVFEKSDIMDHVSIKQNERGVVVSLEDTILFDPGSADIKAETRPLLALLAGIIRETKFPVSIEGHTDISPTGNSRYSSNWELSTARATTVLVHLLREHGLSPERFSVSGYGEYRPITSNIGPEGRSKNRRVDIVFVTRKEGV